MLAEEKVRRIVDTWVCPDIRPFPVILEVIPLAFDEDIVRGVPHYVLTVQDELGRESGVGGERSPVPRGFVKKDENMERQKNVVAEGSEMKPLFSLKDQ